MENKSSSALTRPDQTAILTRGVMRMFIELGISPLAEFKLANGRRADVAGIDHAGKISIAEVKSCRADYESDSKWQDYLQYCDRYFFAVDPTFPRDILPTEEGLILADAYGAVIERPSVERSMAASRRKAVTLRFARQAAYRLTEL